MEVTNHDSLRTFDLPSSSDECDTEPLPGEVVDDGMDFFELGDPSQSDRPVSPSPLLTNPSAEPENDPQIGMTLIHLATLNV